MTAAKKTWVGLGVALVVAAVAAGVLGGDGDKVNQGFVDGAAVLVLVTAVATGIERVLEAVWGFVDRSKKAGAWWPLSVVVDAMTEIEKETSKAFGPILDEAADLAASMTNTAKDAAGLAERSEKAAAEITALVSKAAEDLDKTVAKLAPSSERFAIVTRTSDELASRSRAILTRYGVASDVVESALSSAARAANYTGDVVAAFSKNPARKLMSLAGGMILGLAVAGFLRLNMFVAVVGAADQPKYVIGWGGVVLTGVIVGLGSSPTHEVIRALQRRKDDKVTIPVAEETPSHYLGAGVGLQSLGLIGKQGTSVSVRPMRAIRRTS